MYNDWKPSWWNIVPESIEKRWWAAVFSGNTWIGLMLKAESRGKRGGNFKYFLNGKLIREMCRRFYQRHVRYHWKMDGLKRWGKKWTGHFRGSVIFFFFFWKTNGSLGLRDFNQQRIIRLVWSLEAFAKEKWKK